jgi:BirA family biotin operon repressor/biotin-[acetyl-CoA-carboxylase] ligase
MLKIIEELQLEYKLCKKIYRYSDVGSTNDLARKLLETEKRKKFAIIAEVQTEGKGSNDRVWESPPGGLWSSLAIQPQINLHHLGIVPILSSLGISKALNNLGLEIILKWPNDLLVRRNLKKIGGILVEGKITQSALHYLIIGFGININNSIDQFSPTIRNKITTAFEETNEKYQLLTLINNIILNIEERFDIVMSEGALPIVNEWKEHPNILGMNMIISNKDGEFYGTAIDLTPYGQLILKDSTDEKKTISTGTVTLLKDNN